MDWPERNATQHSFANQTKNFVELGHRKILESNNYLLAKKSIVQSEKATSEGNNIATRNKTTLK